MSYPARYEDGTYYHLISTISLFELHDFANKIGLGGEDFRQRPFVRYDIKAEKAKMVREMGIKSWEITRVERKAREIELKSKELGNLTETK